MPSTWLRPAVVALVLGTALTIANQHHALLNRGSFDVVLMGQMYLTPFAVVLLAQYLGTRQACLDLGNHTLPRPTTRSGWRAVLRGPLFLNSLGMGLVAGSINTAVGVSFAAGPDGGAGNIAPGVIAQAFLLPATFGLLSSTLAYRRQINAQTDPRS